MIVSTSISLVRRVDVHEILDLSEHAIAAVAYLQVTNELEKCLLDFSWKNLDWHL